MPAALESSYTAQLAEGCLSVVGGFELAPCFPSRSQTRINGSRSVPSSANDKVDMLTYSIFPVYIQLYIDKRSRVNAV